MTNPGDAIPLKSFVWCRDAARHPQVFGVEVGDVVRRAGSLNLSETVVRFDGRAWVPLRDVEPRQNESAGKKDDVGAVGAAPKYGIGPDGHVRCACGDCTVVHDDGGGVEPEISGGGVPYPVVEYRKVGNDSLMFGRPLMRRHNIQAVDADADVIGRWMPRDLVTWYVELCGRITGPSSVGGGIDDTVVSGSGKPYGGLGSIKAEATESLKLNAGKKAQKSSVLVRSEWASELKNRTDRKLRKIARELKKLLDEDDEYVTGKKSVGKAERRRCSGKCGKFGESEWLYCARCGGPMEQVD